MPRNIKQPVSTATTWLLKLDLKKLSEERRLKVIMRALLSALENKSISVSDAKEVLALVIA